MALKFNPLTGKLDEYGPVLTGTGTVSAAADGTAALPGIAFASDLNTGIYRPGADQLAISTAGTGRVFVDASGMTHILASYAAPSTGGISANTKFIVSNNNVASGEVNISLLYRSNAKGRLNFGSQIIEDVAYIEGGVNHLAFGTGIGSVSAQERLRIDSSGNVGIGTTIPGDKLEIDGAGAGIILASPDGTRYRLTVANGGTLSIAAV